MCDIQGLVKKDGEYVRDLRRYFHKYPETSWNEVNTSKKIKIELDKLGIPYKNIANTGVIAEINGEYPGKCVLLRADMDALSVVEKNQCQYTSVNEGIMHACGHDGHIAMLIAAAKVLNDLKSKVHGSIKLLFQPAEEVAEGAKACIEEGILERVNGVFAIHLWSDIPCGKISVEEGPRMSSADIFKIKLYGKGGHGAMPHQTVDTVVAASALVMNLQTLISREVNPRESAVVTVGKLIAGSRFNVIAAEATLEGTTRTFNEEIRAQFPEIINRIVENTANTFRAKGELEYKLATPVTINDSNCSKIAEQSVRKILGEEGLTKLDKLTVTEDFGFILQKVPGVLAFVGVRNDKKGINYPQHHERYDIDEEALEIGTALYVQYALDFLELNKITMPEI